MTDEYEQEDENAIKTAGAVSSKCESGDKSCAFKSHFLFFTFIIRIGKADSNGKYNYECYSSGDWTSNSFTGGEGYPDAGMDYILQAIPKSLTLQKDKLSVSYTHNHKAVNGTDYSRCDGGSHYVKYEVKDDPLGLSQMDSCMLVTTCKGKPKNGRTINSYYIHTWKSLSISVSLSANTKKEVGLTITPSKKNKSKQVWSYVTFDF
ncbi:MAG: hypothetical protein ACLRZ9_03335 [Eubacterium sp.]